MSKPKFFPSVLLLFSFLTIILSGKSHAQWLQTGGPNGAEIKCFLKLENQLFVGTSRGIYFRKTMNLLEEWKQTGNKIDSSLLLIDTMEITSLLYKDSYIYAATKGAGVFFSDDLGASWQLFNAGLTNLFTIYLAIIDNTIYVGTESGIFQYDYIKESWTADNNSLIIEKDLKIPKVNYLTLFNKRIFAATKDGVYFREVAEKFWRRPKENYHLNITTFAAKGNIIFAGTDSAGIIMSLDSGLTWKPSIGDISKFINGFYVDERQLLAGTKRGVSYYDERKETWKDYQIGLSENNFYTLSFWKDFYFAGTISGISKANSSIEELSDFNIGLKSLRITDFSIHNNKIYATTLSGIYLSEDKASSWRNIRNNLKDLYVDTILSIELKDSLVFISTNSGVFRSHENTYKWERANIGLIPDVHSFAVNGNQILAAAGKIYSSEDNAGSWKVSTSSPPAEIQKIFVAGKNIIAIAQSEIFYSDDQGNEWKKSPFVAKDSIKNVINAENIFYLYTTKEIFQSQDLSKPWTKISTQLFETVKAVDAFNNFLLASTGDKIFVYNNQTKRWRNATRGLENKMVNALLILGSENKVLAGTDGYSVFERGLTELIPELTRIPIRISGDTLICPGQAITLAASGEYAYQWSLAGSAVVLGNDSVFNIAPQETTKYKVTGRYGSSNTFVVNVLPIEKCYPIKVYQLLSPNDDEANDFFFIENIGHYKENDITIYNKWEEKVFNKRNYNNDWNGDNVPDGMYYYYLKTNGKIYKGNLLIKR